MQHVKMSKNQCQTTCGTPALKTHLATEQLVEPIPKKTNKSRLACHIPIWTPQISY